MALLKKKTSSNLDEVVCNTNWGLRCCTCGQSRAWHGDADELGGLGPVQRNGMQCEGFNAPVPTVPGL